MTSSQSAGIVFNNPGIIDLFSYKIYGDTSLVPKRDTFYATDGTPLLIPSPQSAKAHLQWFSSLNMTNYGVTNESLVLDI